MTDITVEDIPEILRPRLWRPIIIFRKRGEPILFGPGWFSTPEALAWIEMVARKHRHARGGWRTATRAVALTARIAILDAPRADVDRMRTLNRKAAMRAAVQIKGDEGGPGTIWAATLKALAADAARIESLVRRLPGASEAKTATSAASLLIGLGRPMQPIIRRRRWPTAWLPSARLENRDGVTAAAVLDWRNCRRRWPDENDQVGDRLMRKILHRRLAGETDAAARQNDADDLRDVLLGRR